MSLDGLSLSFVVQELHNRLIGGRIDKIFQPQKTTLLLTIRLANETVRLLLSASPDHPRLQITEKALENPEMPPAFCMLLRKHLEGGRISGLEQESLDRIVRLYIDHRDEHGEIVTKCIIAELMGKHSNLILTKNGIIIDAIKRVGLGISRQRQVLPGLAYSLPPGQFRLNLLETGTEIFIKTLLDVPPTSLLTKALIAIAIGVGPVTAREIVYRSGFPSNITLAELDDSDILELRTVIQHFVTTLKNGQPIPTVAVDGNNRVTGIAAFPLDHLPVESQHHFPTMSQAVEYVETRTGHRHVPEKDLLLKLVSGELTRVERKFTILTTEFSIAQNADELRKCADTIMTYLTAIQPHSDKIILPDLYGANPEQDQITIPLDPLLTPIENAQHYYNRYNKQKRAQDLLADQLEQCNKEKAYLETVFVALEQTVTGIDVEDIRLELTQAGYIRATGKRRSSAPLSQPLSGKTTDGTPFLIGKNNRQNDLVTFKHAHADDIWLHTKNIPGSHVILQTGSRVPSPETLTEAAQLAAFFSKSRTSSNVPVDYTRRRYVKKPSGAKPGFVIYDHQTTLFVTPDETTVQALLKKK
ncbi:MAG: Fibronectin-binding domain protein [Firmicutes bacterium]|nr:Fibronectin-binding domain protein [Bacillota bacterium]